MREAELQPIEGSLVVTEGSGDCSFSLVVPTFNERKNMAPLVDSVCGALDRVMAGRYEMIVVDDDSPDGTAQAALDLAQTHVQLRVMRRKNERGLATAVIRGWQAARGTVLGVMDGDLQHPPALLIDLIEQIENGADLAVASRYAATSSVGGWGLRRRLLSRGATTLAEFLLPGLPHISDPLSGFFALRRELIAGLTLNPSGYKILLEVLVRGRQGKIVEVPFDFQPRRHGSTKVALSHYGEYLKHLLELRKHIDGQATANDGKQITR